MNYDYEDSSNSDMLSGVETYAAIYMAIEEINRGAVNILGLKERLLPEEYRINLISKPCKCKYDY